MSDAVIGLEIHVQLGTRTKLFCGDEVAHGGQPNSRVCPVCLGLPGALPVTNVRAVELAARAATLLGCTVHRTSRFVRKNYFYPDLPKGYQITQLAEPIATGGTFTLQSGARIRIRRVHIEEDAGKLLHDRIPGRTAIDLNRCGIPLLEIVTEPDIRSAADAAAFARELRQLLRYADISECDMELGSLRIDANVSVTGTGTDGGRTELKNLNSFAQLERAIDRELARQRDVVAAGGDVANETLAWDADAGELSVLRAKEQPAEYRYFDEPDLPTLHISDELLARAVADLPEPPSARAARMAETFGVPAASAEALTATRTLADYFDAVVAAGVDGRIAAGWVLTEVLAWCGTHTGDIEQYPVPATTLATLLRRHEAGDVTRAGARTVLHELEAGEADADAVIARLGLAERPSPEDVARWIEEVTAAEAPLVARYREGERNLFGFLMGRLMELAGEGADPRDAAKRLRAGLDETA